MHTLAEVFMKLHYVAYVHFCQTFGQSLTTSGNLDKLDTSDKLDKSNELDKIDQHRQYRRIIHIQDTIDNLDIFGDSDNSEYSSKLLIVAF